MARGDRGERLRRCKPAERPVSPQRPSVSLWLRVALVVALAAWAVQGLLGSSHGLMRLRKLRAEVASLHKEQHKLEAERDSLARAESLQATPFYEEKVAREQRGLARKGEIVYRIDRSGTASSR